MTAEERADRIVLNLQRTFAGHAALRVTLPFFKGFISILLADQIKQAIEAAVRDSVFNIMKESLK